MLLAAIEYAEHENKDHQWRLSDLRLGTINLIVGKNASGKTRCLGIIKSLAALLAGERKANFNTGHYRATFKDDQRTITYELCVEQNAVTQEMLKEGDTILLERGVGGVGKIMTRELHKLMQFQSPPDELAVVVRRDSIQHPFLEPLHSWGKRVFYYPFGTSLGKHTMGVFASTGRPVNIKDADEVVPIFRDAVHRFGEQFNKAVCDDMAKLGYAIEDILLEPAPLRVDIELPGPLMGLSVKELGISRRIAQYEISQGMFRALSLIIQINYGAMANSSSTIIVDDIGEGLDFDRSCALINLIIEKAATSQVQLIMATNDRFVMNRVPIEAWTVLKRIDGGSRVYNYFNSKAVFDNFKFTGLNNFDFLAADFIDNQEPPNA